MPQPASADKGAWQRFCMWFDQKEGLMESDAFLSLPGQSRPASTQTCFTRAPPAPPAISCISRPESRITTRHHYQSSPVAQLHLITWSFPPIRVTGHRDRFGSPVDRRLRRVPLRPRQPALPANGRLGAVRAASRWMHGEGEQVISGLRDCCRGEGFIKIH